MMTRPTVARISIIESMSANLLARGAPPGQFSSRSTRSRTWDPTIGNIADSPEGWAIRAGSPGCRPSHFRPTASGDASASPLRAPPTSEDPRTLGWGCLGSTQRASDRAECCLVIEAELRRRMSRDVDRKFKFEAR